MPSMGPFGPAVLIHEPNGPTRDNGPTYDTQYSLTCNLNQSYRSHEIKLFKHRRNKSSDCQDMNVKKRKTGSKQLGN